MARIIVGSWLVRYPLGAVMSWNLQHLVGFQQLGHDVYFVEKSGYPNSCFDPTRNVMSDDCSYGVRAVHDLLSRFGLGDKWCYVDAEGHYYGLTRTRVEEVFDTADLFWDMGGHGAWSEEASRCGLRALADGDPAFTQIKMEQRMAAGDTLPQYDEYYTVGQNLPTGQSSVPAAGKRWRAFFDPVVLDLFAASPIDPAAPFTTVMNWQSYDVVEYNGIIFGMKDVEFERFMDLPHMVSTPLEVAIAGKDIPVRRLTGAGWRLRNAHHVTASYDSFLAYVRASAGEFSVCKHGYVETNSGFFSDRSAAYLASGRPVILQETGFSDHLPCGRGLLAVRTLEEAADAIAAVSSDYARHARWAREVAAEHLDARKVLRTLLSGVGM